MSRRIHLTGIPAHLDGSPVLSITLTQTPAGDYVIAIRPHGKRRVYSGLLSIAALMVAARDAKETVAAAGIVVPRARKGKVR